MDSFLLTAMFMPGLQEVLPLLIIGALLFGARRIPEIMKDLARGIKEFKKGLAEDSETPQPQGDAR